MLTAATLLAMWRQRESDAGPKRARDRETLQYMEGRVGVPLPEMDKITRTAVANLMLSGMTGLSRRASSTGANVTFAINNQSKAAAKRARAKQRAVQGMWDENRIRLQDRQRVRWFYTYATSPVMVRPRFYAGKWSIKWEPRTALSAYAAPTPTHLDMEPHDTIFPTTLAASKIEAAWPESANTIRALRGWRSDDPRDPTLTLVEYTGPDAYACAVIGQQSEHSDGVTLNEVGIATKGRDFCVVVELVKNPIGRSFAIIPNNISVEQPHSQYEGMKGLYDWQATLMAKEYRAVANSVDPAVWFVENENGGGAIIEVADGPAGKVGHVRGGDLQILQHTPNAHAPVVIDRLERAMRLEGGIPADMQGESGTNIRTARRGSELLAAVLDFDIQECQEVMAESKRLETNLAIDLALATFPDLDRSWGGFNFTPEQTFSKPTRHTHPNGITELRNEDWLTVSYSLAGADANGQVIRVGQLVGTGLMSEETGRSLLPDIDDPEREHDLVISEQIEKGIMADFMQPSAPGAPLDIVGKARVAQLVRSDTKELAEAILQVQRETQEQQSPLVDPVASGAPEAMPGIGGPAQQAGVEAPQSDLAGLSSLLTRLRGPQVFGTEQEARAGAQAAL